MLLSIIIPAIRTVARLSEQAETGAYISALSTGTHLYKNEHNYFPGATGSDRDDLDNAATTGKTGSQLLAQALFTDSTNFPTTTAYCDFKPGYLAEIATKSDTLSEQTKDPLAICYFPADAAVGPDGSVAGQFDVAHNQAYITGNGNTADFITHITDTRVNRPFNSGTFLLIAPGPDQEYFTIDDVQNFPNN